MKNSNLSTDLNRNLSINIDYNSKNQNNNSKKLKNLMYLFIFIISISIYSSNTYSIENNNLYFENLYNNQLNLSNKLYDYINYGFYTNKVYTQINIKEDYFNYFISKDYSLFYKNYEDLWILRYNTLKLSENNFDYIYKEDIIVEIPFTYSPREINEYDELYDFSLELKEIIESKNKVVFVMDENLSTKMVASIINLGRFFVDTGIFYHKEVIYGSIQGENADLLTINDLDNESLMFYFISNINNNYNYNLTYNKVFFDKNQDNLVYIRDRDDLLKIIDYISLSLIGVKI